jgi:4-alpha-glucanotransferase
VTGAAVRELAEAAGVATEFTDWQGRHAPVPDATVVAVLTALGLDAHSGDAAAESLAELGAKRWRQMLPPTVVVRQGAAPRVWVHVPHGEPVEVWVRLEDGSRRDDLAQLDHWVEPRRVDGELVGEATFILPADLPLGWHHLEARCGPATATSTLVVTPTSLAGPGAGSGAGPGDGTGDGTGTDARSWGFLTQIYQVRSAGSWGVGDLRDLADLAAWSGRDLGAGFVLVNPLHAASPRAPMEASPYLPVTRRFANPLYLRVEDVAEYDSLDAGQRAAVAALHESLRTPLAGRDGEADTIDRDRAWLAKRAALEIVAGVPLSSSRSAQLAAFRAREGDGLVDFATWCALVDEHGLRWRDWPLALQDPGSPAVAAERVRLRPAVELHTRLQWWVDEQLAAAQSVARAAGMSVGVVHDLAVGVDPNGFDAWALHAVLATGVSVGAPPDAFNQQGQGWSQPPWLPDELAESGYAAYRDMLRAVLRHAGGIRVDHVLGLFRLWLVPDGASPADGTYLRYDHEALVGILALEAYRAGALVIGEDLGTVEPWVREFLLDRGIAGTSILWFERSWSGEPLAAEQWRSLCLASVTTHDLPPTAGYLQGEHVRIREELGLLTRPAADERAADEAEREAWLAVLREGGFLAAGDTGVEGVVEALHRFLVATPARLLGVSLPDAVGDLRAQNQPGTNTEYPNWRLPLTDSAGQPVWLEDLPGLQRLRSLVAVMAAAPARTDVRGEPAG